jgi:hypothetical protein
MSSEHYAVCCCPPCIPVTLTHLPNCMVLTTIMATTSPCSSHSSSPNSFEMIGHGAYCLGSTPHRTMPRGHLARPPRPPRQGSGSIQSHDVQQHGTAWLWVTCSPQGLVNQGGPLNRPTSHIAMDGALQSPHPSRSLAQPRRCIPVDRCDHLHVAAQQNLHLQHSR